MPNILYPPPRPQSVGEILDSAFRIFRATLLKCLPYATIAVIAGQLPTLYNMATGRPLLPPEQTSDPLAWVLYTWVRQIRDPLWWASSLIVTVLGSAILLRQHAIATGRPTAMSVDLATGVRRLPGVLALLVLSGLAIAVCVLPAFALHGPMRYLLLLLLLVPASCLAIALSCGWPVLLVTGKGALASMIHSARLTWGSWWRLSLIYTVAAVLLGALYSLAGVIALVLAMVLAHGDIAVVTAVTTVTMLILAAVGTPFFWALALAVLGDLTARREGADLAQRLSAPATQ
jgi:hypothetical protein